MALAREIAAGVRATFGVDSSGPEPVCSTGGPATW